MTALRICTLPIEKSVSGTVQRASAMVNGSTADCAYDAEGNRTSMTSGAGTETYTLDPLNRLTSVTDANSDIVAYTYDATGNRLTRLSTAPRRIPTRMTTPINSPATAPTATPTMRPATR
jgi:YD repeat-containing protein